MRTTGRIDAIIGRELLPGETVRWIAHAHPAAVLVDQLYNIIFSLVWCGGLGWALTQKDVHESEWGVLGISLMLAFGIYIIGSSIIDVAFASETRYAITDKRLIVAKKHGRPLSLKLGSVRGVERMSSGATRGTLRIPLAMVSDGDGGEKMEYLKLYGVANPDEAYRLLAV